MSRDHHPDALPTLLRDTLDDDRMYYLRFRANKDGDGMNPPADELQAQVEEQAEALERTVGCVTAVIRDDSRLLATGAGFEDIVLYALLPRHIDRELFHRVADEARHQAMTDVYEEGEP